MNIADIIYFAVPEASGWLVQIILWIVKISSSIALGVILFTLLLKLITTPFDIISKVQMRKNSLIMEEMRPELEKLQKQYANDKNLYSQKMMALYKKNGYSMFGACLPTIVTLVIFIVAISGFNNYSKYQNKKYFYDMSRAFNTAVYNGLTVDNDLVKKITDENNDKIYKLSFDNKKIVENGSPNYVIEVNSAENYYTITTNNDYILYKCFYDTNFATVTDEYLVKADVLETKTQLKNGKGQNFAEFKSANPDLEKVEVAFINSIGSMYSASQYRTESNQFLWVKNIWAVDSPLSHPIETVWESKNQASCASCFGSQSMGFKTTQGYTTGSGENMSSTYYDLLIADLDTEKTTANGYFILPVLTALMSFLTQLVLGKSQKATMELQTVDGQGAQQQKMMMWMMPIMMAIFAFMYTATFSIYMILSQVLSIVSTLLTNYFIDKKYKSNGKEAEKIRGRVHQPKPEEKTETKSKKSYNEPTTPDFINGGKVTQKANKHVNTNPRGRLK